MSTKSKPKKLLKILFLFFLLAMGNWSAPAVAQDEEVGLDWVYGPATVALGNIAEVDIPEGFQFVDGDGSREIMHWMENPTNGSEMGLVMPIPEEDDSDFWFVIFDYSPVGFVKDDEKDELDADAILKSISEGTEAGNDIRRENGWQEYHVRGWQTPPFYDPVTNNLKWAIIGYSNADESINFSTRILGRGGAMSADLVLSPEALHTALEPYENILAGFRYTQGNRYAEFRKGDKVAQFGLTALVAGGVGAVAMKTGILARFWKFIVFGAVAVFGAVRRFFGKFFGGNKPDDDVNQA